MANLSYPYYTTFKDLYEDIQEAIVEKRKSILDLYREDVEEYYKYKLDQVEQDIINSLTSRVANEVGSSYTIDASSITIIDKGRVLMDISNLINKMKNGINNYISDIKFKKTYDVRKFLTVFISYVSVKDLKPYINTDYPHCPPYKNNVDLKYFFTYYDRITLFDPSDLFIITADYSYNFPKYTINGKTVSITGSLVFRKIPTRNFNDLYNKTVNGANIDVEKMKDFIDWFNKLTVLSDVYLWTTFKKDKIPNRNSNELNIRKILDDKYQLTTIVEELKLQIPGM